jgi:hypothetical protein
MTAIVDTNTDKILQYRADGNISFGRVISFNFYIINAES